MIELCVKCKARLGDEDEETPNRCPNCKQKVEEVMTVYRSEAERPAHH